MPIFSVGMYDPVINYPRALWQWPCHLVSLLLNRVKRIWQVSLTPEDVRQHFKELSFQNVRYLTSDQLSGIQTIRVATDNDDGRNLLRLIEACFRKTLDRSGVATDKSAYGDWQEAAADKLCAALGPSQLQFILSWSSVKPSKQKMISEIVRRCDMEQETQRTSVYNHLIHNTANLTVTELLSQNKMGAFIDRATSEQLFTLFKVCLTVLNNEQEARQLNAMLIPKLVDYLTNGPGEKSERIFKLTTIMKVDESSSAGNFFSYNHFKLFAAQLDFNAIYDLAATKSIFGRYAYVYIWQNKEQFQVALDDKCSQLQAGGFETWHATYCPFSWTQTALPEDYCSARFLFQGVYFKHLKHLWFTTKQMPLSENSAPHLIAMCTVTELIENNIILQQNQVCCLTFEKRLEYMKSRPAGELIPIVGYLRKQKQGSWTNTKETSSAENALEVLLERQLSSEEVTQLKEICHEQTAEEATNLIHDLTVRFQFHQKLVGYIQRVRQLA